MLENARITGVGGPSTIETLIDGAMSAQIASQLVYSPHTSTGTGCGA